MLLGATIQSISLKQTFLKKGKTYEKGSSNFTKSETPP